MQFFDPAAIARCLLRLGELRVQSITGGRNAEVWRVDTPAGMYALKRYARSDALDRLAREATALRFLESHKVSNVPRLVGENQEYGVILLSWLPGDPVSVPSECDIQACTDFIAQLRQFSRSGDARMLPAAKEACPSVAEILSQVDARVTKLATAGNRDFGLRHFIDAEVMPRRRQLTSLQQKYPDDTPKEFMTLSPSDFGLHNAVRGTDGRISFLDFEYFGWDDPVKLAADFLLHPAMRLSPRLRSAFVAGVRGVFGAEPNFGERLCALLPAYQLRWALIMMNPILDAAAAPAQGEADMMATVRAETRRVENFLRSTSALVSGEGGSYAG